MPSWIKIEHTLSNGDPLLDTYINLDTVTQIEYNHANDTFSLSLMDSEEKVVILPEYDEAYARVKAYLAQIR